MIKQIHISYQYTTKDLRCIAEAKRNWESGKVCIKNLKIKLNSFFDTNQNEKCCYCGLSYGITGRGEVDHIAPKGEEFYPKFSFHAKNLVKACQLCNSSSMKHTYDSIEILGDNYENCEFKFVHPYLDDPDEHYSWNYGVINVIISVKNNSSKAEESIRLFELDSEKRTRARAMQRNYELKLRTYKVTEQAIKLIYSAISYPF